MVEIVILTLVVFGFLIGVRSKGLGRKQVGKYDGEMDLMD